VRVQCVPDNGEPVGVSAIEYVSRQPINALTVGTDTIGTFGVLPSGAGMRAHRRDSPQG
jgi:hypothetical protein